MKTNVQQSQSLTRISDIPDGFTTRTGPDGQHYLVPQYMVPALDQAFVMYRTKADLGVRNAPAGVSKNFITNGSSRMSVPTLSLSVGTDRAIGNSSNCVNIDIPFT